MGARIGRTALEEPDASDGPSLVGAELDSYLDGAWIWIDRLERRDCARPDAAWETSRRRWCAGAHCDGATGPGGLGAVRVICGTGLDRHRAVDHRRAGLIRPRRGSVCGVP